MKISKTLKLTMLAITMGITGSQLLVEAEIKSKTLIRAGDGSCETCDGPKAKGWLCRVRTETPVPEGENGLTLAGDSYIPDGRYYTYDLNMSNYCTDAISSWRVGNQAEGKTEATMLFNEEVACEPKDNAPEMFQCGRTWVCNADGDECPTGK